MKEFYRRFCWGRLLLITFALFANGTLFHVSAQTFTDQSVRLNPLANGFEWGCSAADFNNDGLVDIYHRGRLYLNRGVDGFENVLPQTGINEGSNIFGAAFGDYNNDAYLDVIFEDFSNPSKLYRNNGDRTFTQANSGANVAVHTLAQGAGWADFNLDGTLDLFVNNDFGNNQLFKNTNLNTFLDISISAGVPTNGNSYGMAWGDFNNDRYPDVFIATCNSNPANSIKHLLLNNGDETFTDINVSAGVNDSLASWGNVWLDYDNDGLLDVYIANTDHGGNIRGYNRLYRNNGDSTFTNVAFLANVTGAATGNSYGCAAVDFDNDGWQDIYVANSSQFHKLFRNNGNGTFSDISVAAGIIENNHRAVAVADFDNDGWFDIFTAGSPNNRLMMNNGGSNHWITVQARGVTSTYHGVGARVEVYTDSLRQIREIRAGDGFCSQNDLLRAHFGLGSRTSVDSVIIRWPSGLIDVVTSVGVDQHVTVVEGTGLNNAPSTFALMAPLDGDTLQATHMTLTWSASLNPEPETLTYSVHLEGAGLDSVFTVSDTSIILPGGLFQENASYTWYVEVTDGYSVVAGTDIFGFVAAPQLALFTKVTQGAIVSDGGFSEGALAGDFNGDHFPDLFVANNLNQNNFLYSNNGDGTFDPVIAGPVVTELGNSYGGTFGDFDNDDDLDLFVNNGLINSDFVNFYYRNDGAGNFVKILTGAIATDAGRSWSSSSSDYNNDGHLDLFVANYNQNNALYRNEGGGTFVRIASGDPVNDGGTSLGNAWGDYDNDGDADLFVANADFGGGQVNFLYENNGDGTFTRILSGSIVTDVANSVGASWGDFNGDGYVDLYVTNYTGEANYLYMNDGAGGFTKLDSSVAVLDVGSSVGSSWGDYDNDGDLDLFVANDLNETNWLYENKGDGTFTKIVQGDVTADVGRSNGTVWADFDRDGDLDLFVTNGDFTPQSNAMYLNAGVSGFNSISVKCEGVASNTSGIGTRLTAMVSGLPVQVRQIWGQTGYNAQNDPEVHFGLGTESTVDSLLIHWPSGQVDVYTNLAANEFYSAVEGLGIVIVSVEDGGQAVPKAFVLEQNFPNPFNPATTIRFSIGEPAHVDVAVYNLLGQRVATVMKGTRDAGVHSVVWNGRSDAGVLVGSGVYVYRVTAGSEASARKMILLK